MTKDSCFSLLHLSYFLVDGLTGGVAPLTVMADNPTLCELVLIHKEPIVESGAPGKNDRVYVR